MRLFWQLLTVCFLCIGTGASGVKADAAAPELELLRTQVLVRQSALDQAESQLTRARLRVHSLTTQKQLLEANRPQTVPTRNPQWDALHSELREAEGTLRRLAEKLASAHPEMQAAESEVQSIKEKLAAIPEYLSASSTVSAYETSDLDAETKLNAHLLNAEQELAQAESVWQAATREYQRALAALAEWRPAAAVIEPPAVEKTSSTQIGSVWVAIGVFVFLLGAFLWRQNAASTMAATVGAKPRPRHSTRIIYPAHAPAKPMPPRKPTRLESPPSLPNRRTPIVPRRRTAIAD